MTLLMMCGITLAALPLAAETETVDGYTWTYRISGDTAEIYNPWSNHWSTAVAPSPTGVVTIPSLLGDKLVTSIGEAAFYNCTNLTSVTIPSSVTNIGDAAFYNCTNLTRVTIPNGVTDIGYMAFRYCNGLTSVTIPNGVMNIGDYAFEYCGGLTNVNLSSCGISWEKAP